MSVDQSEIHPKTKFLVSICNMETPQASGLLLHDLSSGETRRIDLGHEQTMNVKSSIGIYCDDQLVYHIYLLTPRSVQIVALSRDDLRPVFCQHLPEIVDPHSIYIWNQRLYVVSTGTDEVLEYKVKRNRFTNRRVIWAASRQKKDTHHLNSIAVIDGDLYCTGFGPKEGERWSTATNGYIYNITRDQYIKTNIYHPHTIIQWLGTIYYCDSSRARFCSLSQDICSLDGYVRGATFLDRYTALVGTSVGRKVSKSTGIVNNPADPGEVSGRCLITQLDIRDGQVINTIDLSAFGNEIYDIWAI